MKIVNIILFGFLFFLSAPIGFSQSEWIFQKEENGVKAWTRQVEGSKFVAYKVETIANGSISSCVAVLHDESIYTELFEDTKETFLVEKFNDAHIITYLHTNLPFPVKDRDGYYDNHFEYIGNKDLIHVRFNCLEGFDKKKRVIRLDYCQGGWEFFKLNESEVKITHFFHTDPKGAIPAWIVNKRTVDSPIYTLLAMKRLVAMPKYNEQSFDFIE